jgi:hypothetical protein
MFWLLDELIIVCCLNGLSMFWLLDELIIVCCLNGLSMFWLLDELIIVCCLNGLSMFWLLDELIIVCCLNGLSMFWLLLLKGGGYTILRLFGFDYGLFIVLDVLLVASIDEIWLLSDKLLIT